MSFSHSFTQLPPPPGKALGSHLSRDVVKNRPLTKFYGNQNETMISLFVKNHINEIAHFKDREEKLIIKSLCQRETMYNGIL